MPAHAHPHSQLNAALSGRYTIERELGAGGMATVYLAHDVRHDRKVARKVLRPELTRVAVAPGASFAVRDHRVLFSLRGVLDWDVSPDGTRIITIRERGGRQRSTLVVVENFFQELRAKVPR